MLDKSKIGQSYPPFTFEVERGKVHELALAIGDPTPIYHSREAAQAAGYQDVPLYPTFPTLFSFWADRSGGQVFQDLGLDPRNALHGEEEYEYLAPIYPGDKITGVTTILDAKSRQGKIGSSMEIVTLEKRFTNQHGQAVLIARTMAVVVVNE